MDVYRFVKLPQKANDPARRYIIVSVTGERVGELEVIPPRQGAVVMSLACSPVLSDAASEDALSTALRFLDELALGWGVHLLEERRDSEEHPDGSRRSRVAFRAA